MHNSPAMNVSSQKIAVMKFSALGDIAATLPLLREMDPAPCIITSPIGKAFYEDEFPDFIVLPNKNPLNIFRLVKRIRDRHFTDLIDLQGNDRCRFICRTATLISQTKQHNGFDTNRTPPYSLFVKELHAAATARLIYQPKPRGYIVLNTGSSAKWSAKRLPAWKWEEFATQLNARFGLPFKLTGSREEIDYIRSISDQIPFDTEVLAGKTSLPELKHILKGAFLTVSTDSAAMHISAVEKTPTIGLFGSTSPISLPAQKWVTALYDKTYYPDGQLPQCTDIIDNYYDNIRIEDGLAQLEPYL
tara:strand:+ start:910 stop:1818 length:909 start_codon:yes stop_codon:yes gene_type:complete